MPTKNQIEYRKQLNRIRRIVNKYSKNYYVEFQMPETPDRITKKDIARLKNITPTTIRETAYTNFFNPETGEYRTAQDIFDLRRRSVKGREVDIIITNVRRIIRETDAPIFLGQPILSSKFEQLLSMYGERLTAQAFKFANENYDILNRKLLYNAVDTQFYVNNLVAFFDKYIGLSDEEIDYLNSYGDYI